MKKTRVYFWLLPFLVMSTYGETIRIGIVGAGIGGTSCAYFLRTMLGPKAHIDIYEAESVGGRLATTKLKNKDFEIGGAIVHPKNEYMVDFITLLNIPRKEGSFGNFGVYDGEKFVFSESNWKILTLAKLVWRYGLGPYKLDNYINIILEHFSRIYKLQDLGHSFNNVTSMLAAMHPSFVGNLQTSTKDGFKKLGFSEKLIDELIMATLTANYGQDTNVHQFVGSVSVAGASGGLWAVHGGNKKVAEGLLKLSKANLVSLLVTGVKKLQNKKIMITTKERSDIPIEDHTRSYDVVILASPQTEDMQYRVQLSHFSDDIQFDGKYHKTICTIIHGQLNNSYFRTKDKYVNDILTTKTSLMFNSIGQILPVDSSHCDNIWKIFSQEELSYEQLNLLFTNIQQVFVKEWLAYPHYDCDQRNDNFVLDTNLYHINAIEWAASAMEMSVIGAKNVAILAYKYINNINFDTVLHPEKNKDEL